MATINELVTRISRRLRRSAPSGSNFQGEILDELAHAQNTFEEAPTLPWFLERTEDVSLLANVFQLPFSGLARTFIRLWDDEPLTYTDPTGAAAENIVLPLDSELLLLKQRYPGTGLVPKEAVAINEIMEIRPKPTQAITYQLHYFHKDPTVPAEDATTLWSTHFADLLMNKAGVEIAWSLRDSVAEARFEKNFAFAYTQYIKAVEARNNAGQVHVMGDP